MFTFIVSSDTQGMKRVPRPTAVTETAGTEEIQRVEDGYKITLSKEELGKSVLVKSNETFSIVAKTTSFGRVTLQVKPVPSSSHSWTGSIGKVPTVVNTLADYRRQNTVPLNKDTTYEIVISRADVGIPVDAEAILFNAGSPAPEGFRIEDIVHQLDLSHR